MSKSRLLELKMFSRREMKAFFLLSIVVPVSLLTGFRLTGLLSEPQRPEALMAKAAEFSLEKPFWTIHINRTVENSFEDETILAVFDVLVFKYFDGMGPPFGSSDDVFNMDVSVRASSIDGVIESVDVVFMDESQYARVNIPDPTALGYAAAYTTSNVSVTGWSDCIHKQWELTNSTKATIRATSVGTPSDVRFRLPAYWVLGNDGEKMWQIDIISEITYRTSSTYRTLSLPIRLMLFSQPT